MKKRIISLALALVLTLALAAPAFAEEEEQTPAPEYRLVSVTGENMGPYTFTYDQGGWLPTTVYNGNGEAVITASYDAAGRVISLEKYGADTDTYTYEYDENGNQLSSSSHYMTYNFNYGVIACDENDVSTYDANGNRIHYESTEVLGDRTTVTEGEYVYDDAGHMLSDKIYTNGELVSEGQYTYDEVGNMLSLTRNYSDGTSYKRTCTYDETGNMLSETTYNDGEVSSEATCTYDEAGNMLSETTYSDGEVSSETTYTYDDEGRMIQEDYISDDFSNSTIYTPLQRVHLYQSWVDYNLYDREGINLLPGDGTGYTGEPEVTYDDNGYVTQIGLGDGTAIVFTYEPVA